MGSAPKPAPHIERFEQMRFGLMIHWGLYSLLKRGEWVMFRESIPAAEYNKLRDRFTAQEFDARAIARLAKEAGMRFIILTTRHHDGFSLYDTRGLSDFDAPHSAAGRDLVLEFVDGCRAEGIVPFFYHTTLDWQWDSKNCDLQTFNKYLDYLYASVEILCTRYGPIGGFNFDGNWSRWDADWREGRLYEMIRRHQPEAVIINNPGVGRAGHVSHPEVDVYNLEQHQAKVFDQEGQDKYRAVRSSQTINVHWGIAERDLQYKSPAKIIETLAKCVGVGACYTVNIGPTGAGAVTEMEAAILRTVGKWTHLHEEAIYMAKPLPGVVCEGRDFVVENSAARWSCFVHDLSARGAPDPAVSVKGPGPRTLKGVQRKIRRVRWLDNHEELQVEQDLEKGTAAIRFTAYPYGTDLVARVAHIEWQ